MERNLIIERLTLIFHETFSDSNIVLRDDMTAWTELSEIQTGLCGGVR